MLRALAGYLLGGILNDSPQETMECETREVNDWLVVNMPNKPEESDIDFNSERESDIDEQEILEDRDIDFGSNTESEIDEDEILTSLPILMTYDEFGCQESIFGGKTPIEETSVVVLQNTNQIQRIQVDDSRFLSQGKFHSKPDSNARPSPKLDESNIFLFKPTPPSSLFDYHIRKGPEKTPFLSRVVYPNSVKKVPTNSHISPTQKMDARKAEIIKSWDEEIEPCLAQFLDIEFIRSIWPTDVLNFPAKLDLTKSPYTKPELALLLSSSNGISAPSLLRILGDERASRRIQMPTFIKHQPYESVIDKEDLKKHLQEQIKELRPSQQAKALSIKKQNSRSQLKRHNQNYIYCTSAKASRRKDLQRNHSGANNNRKC